MEFNILPTDYAVTIRKNAKAAEGQKNNQLSAEIAKIEEEYSAKFKKVPTLEKTFGSYISNMCKGVSILFLAIAIIGITVALFFAFGEGFWWKLLALVTGIVGGALAGFLAGPIYGFICGPILGVVLSPIGYPIFRAVCNKKNKKAEAAYLELAREKALDIERAKNDARSKIAQINKDAEERIASYTQMFEQRAQELSVNYANSSLAKEVIAWLTDGFLKTIYAADRAAHIERITVPFKFYVREGEITCNTGAYNFEQHRCENLPNVLAQAALARAIASQIQLRVMMQYDKDSSGTDYVIDITYSYSQNTSSSYYYSYNSRHYDYVLADLVYSAPNGNYKPVQKW